jgi:ATP-dependent nuclease, subunit B
VGSGLRAESREIFELDVKEQGSFQHDALAEFHLQLASEGKRWRDITPKEARERIAAITASMALTYRGGLFQATEQGRFVARNLGVDLQNFVETLLGWMGNQYGFDPVAVELPFGQDESSPAWEIELSQGRRLAVYGRIDRVDILRRAESDEGLCVVVDYKSSHRRLDPVLLAHGIQLQLLTYLNVLRSWQNPEELFKVRRLIPSGVFYVNLAGKFSGDTNRTKAFAGGEEARMLAYQHAGRFDAQFLRFLDARANATKGDQFNYRILKSGLPDKRSRDVMQTAEFISLLDSIEASLVTMGEEVFAGSAKIDPFQKGSAIACDHCDYRSICRIDPWTHSYRVLKQEDPD